MKFKDVDIYTWIKYQDDVWFVANARYDACYLANSRNDMWVKASEFDQHHAESVKPQIFQCGDIVIYTNEGKKTFHNKLVNIVDVNRDIFETFPYRIEFDNHQTWATPFDLTKITY